MTYENYLSQTKKIQQIILDFFDSNGNNENIIYNVNIFFNDLKKGQNLHQLKEILHLISKIANNYHRHSYFFKVFIEFFTIYKEDILQKFTNRQIFRIFHSNKWILLILFIEQILVPDNYILNTFKQTKYLQKSYLQYFYPEFRDFLNEKDLKEINDSISQLSNDSELLIDYKNASSNFEQKRQNGENDQYICTLIQKDLVEEFITYVNQTNLSLNITIKPSIFETNSFLLKSKKTSLIEYAAFFGSIQILRYLFMSEVELTSSLWLYSIHGKNPEMIHFLEENKIIPEDKSYATCLIEAIKCHHNDIAAYIQTNLLSLQDKNRDFNYLFYCRKYHNYYFFPEELKIDTDIFYDFCEFDYITLVDLSLQSQGINFSSFKNRIAKIFHINKTTEEETPIQIAAKKGNIEIVELLLNIKEIDINGRSTEKVGSTAYNRTPLTTAVQNGDIEMVKLLLTHPKIDVNKKSIRTFLAEGYHEYQESMSVLHLAIVNDDLQMVDFLLTKKSIDVNEKTIVIFAHRSDQVITAKTPLFLAVELNRFDIVKILISKSENIDVNLTSLDKHHSPKEYSDSLLEANALHEAVLTGNYEIVQLLLSSRNDININSCFKFKKRDDDVLNEKSCLFAACEMKMKEIVSILLSRENININCVNIFKFKNNEGYCEEIPLYIAVEKEDVDIVRLLLDRNDIDVNYKSKYSSSQQSMSWSEYKEMTPLHLAVEKENAEIVQLLITIQKLNINDVFLLTRKIYIGAMRQIERTALLLAIEKNLPDIVSILLTRKDVNVNVLFHSFKKRFGFFTSEEIMKTALHMAVEENSIDIIRLLLAYNGIDISIKNQSGKTPIDIATNDEIIKLLKKE